MEIITNKFLKSITLGASDLLYENLCEANELQEVDKKNEEEAIRAFFNIMVKKQKEMNHLYKDFESDSEKLLVMQFASIQFYFDKKDDNRIREQLNLCEKIIASDICRRNLRLLDELIMEAEKLKMALETKFVVFACSFLNEFYKKTYPSMNKTDRYVRISEFMNLFSTNNTVKFYTLEEANIEILKRDINTTNAKAYIKDKIKYYVKT